VRFSDPEHLEAPDRDFIGHRDIVTRNMARYQFILPHVHGVVADVGCGRGYGLAILRRAATRCYGLDLSPEFLGDLQIEQPDIPAVLASGDRLPFANQSFDTLVSFEVIEHIDDDLGFLHELRRTIRPGGTLIISTPNRIAASGTATQPLNKFHVREYILDDFHKLLQQVFPVVQLYGQSEGTSRRVHTDSIADRIPVEWKYLLPIHVQSVLSVLVRKPLRIEDCHFVTEHIEHSHTLLAICHVS
jgi:SAM-dependent methyltransferase